MLGTIKIEKQKVCCIIGILEQERKEPQDIFIDLEMKSDFTSCVHSESVEDTVDYVRVVDICKSLATKGKYQLIETYAHQLLETLFDTFDIFWAKVEVRKPQALSEADCAAVILEKQQELVNS